MRFLRKDLLQVQKSRRSGFRKATLLGVLAVSLTFAFSSRVSAQSSPGSSTPEASTFITKLDGTVVSDAVTTTVQTTEEDKIFFLYNESETYEGVKGKFLNLGGYWGTHVALSDAPYPFRLEKAGDGTYYIVSNKQVSANTSVEDNGIGSGDYVGWATNNKTADKDPSISSYGVFASLSKPSSGDDSQFAWHFEKVGSTDKYHIYLDLKNVNVPTVAKDAIPTESNPTASTTATISWGDPVSGKFYLEATTSENVYGDYNEDTDKYPTDPDYHADMGGTPIVLRYPGAEACQETTTPAGDTSEWKLISLAEYNKLFDKSYKELTGNENGDDFPDDLFDEPEFSSSKINVSYLLHDPDFQINNPELNHWNYRNTDGASVDIKDYLSVGFDGYLKSATGNNGFSDTYTNKYTDIDGNSKTLTDYQISNRARHMGVQVKERIANGEFGKVLGELYQTIQITKPGLYTLSGNYATDYNTTLVPTIFVRFYDQTKEPNSYGNTKYSYKDFYNLNILDEDKKGWPYSIGFPMYNALIYNYEGDVNFYISPKMLAMVGGSFSVEFGAIIDQTKSGSQNSKPYISTFANENSDETNSSDEVNYAWTVIDKFQLSFRGLPKPDLILDEDEENLDYVEKASDSYAYLRLHRTFSSGNWNSIILPVGLTQEQYTSAFGDAPLAELSGLTQSEIQFTTVKKSSKYEKDGVNDNTQYWLKPMTPYIIKANKANGGNTDEYEGTYTYWDEYTNDENDKTFTKSIDGSTKPYFLISNVKMVNGIIPTTTHEGTNYEYQNKIAPMWNFKGLTATTNTKNESGTDENVACPYVVTTAQKESTKGSIAAFGTLARNYQETTTTTDGTTTTTPSLIAGRPSLKDSYIMSGGELKYLSQGIKMKGFRCWFEYATKQSSTGGTSSAKPMLMLDGVNMTTGIDEIMANDEGTSLVNQYQEGIYSIGGQRISKDASCFDALPKGLYIVNGKKVIKN